MSEPQEDRFAFHTYNYDQTRAFAESVGKILVDKYLKRLQRFGIPLREEARCFLIIIKTPREKQLLQFSRLDHLSQPYYKRTILNCIYISLV
jgi:hypothetical protein